MAKKKSGGKEGSAAGQPRWGAKPRACGEISHAAKETPRKSLRSRGAFLVTAALRLATASQISVERPKTVKLGVASEAPAPLCSVYPVAENSFSLA